MKKKTGYEKKMIQLTYTHICDLCKTEIDTETYNCTNLIHVSFPRPMSRYTYQLGAVMELCNECAAPISKARDEVIDQWKDGMK